MQLLAFRLTWALGDSFTHSLVCLLAYASHSFINHSRNEWSHESDLGWSERGFGNWCSSPHVMRWCLHPRASCQQDASKKRWIVPPISIHAPLHYCV